MRFFRSLIIGCGDSKQSATNASGAQKPYSLSYARPDVRSRGLESDDASRDGGCRPFVRPPPRELLLELGTWPHKSGGRRRDDLASVRRRSEAGRGLALLRSPPYEAMVLPRTGCVCAKRRRLQGIECFSLYVEHRHRLSRVHFYPFCTLFTLLLGYTR